MFYLVASSLGHLRSQCSNACGSSLQSGYKGGVCGWVEEIVIGFQRRSVAGSKVRKEDRVRSVVNDHVIFGTGEPAIHLRCPRVCWWCIF